MLIRSLLLGVALTLVPSLAQAQGSGAAPQQPQAGMPAQSQPTAPATTTDPAMFTSMAAIGDLFEIRSSELAAERSQNQEVKDFAQQMIADHGMASDKLMQAATEQGFQPPQELDERHQTIMQQLEGQQGEAFDRAYLDAQVKAHDEAVALFETYSAGGPDGALKTHATETLPTLKQHQEHVRSLAGAGGAAAAGAAPAGGGGADLKGIQGAPPVGTGGNQTGTQGNRN